MANEEEIFSILQRSNDEAALLLGAASNPVRLRILALLLRGDQDYPSLMDATSLSKTALANHMQQLLRRRMVARVSRGRYRLTADGNDLVKAAAILVKDSHLREKARRRRLRWAYDLFGLLEEVSAKKRIIDRPVEMLPCILTFVGAIGGALRTLGVECDTVDVAGQSGYAFLANMPRNTISSTPTAFHEEAWHEIIQGVQELGWRLDSYEDSAISVDEEAAPEPEAYEEAKNLFDRVKASIDVGKPVVIWGLGIPEYGIVKGYEGASYLVSTARRFADREDSPVPFYILHGLHGTGSLHAIFFEAKIRTGQADRDRSALSRSIRLASGEVPARDGYTVGPGAFDVWADLLEMEESTSKTHYVAASFLECRELARKFLSRMADRTQERVAKELKLASTSYQRNVKLMKRLASLTAKERMTKADRAKGAEMLRKAKTFEEEAVEHMKKAKTLLVTEVRR